jgi:hypothetical protein
LVRDDIKTSASVVKVDVYGGSGVRDARVWRRVFGPSDATSAMVDFERFVQQTARSAGRRYAEMRRAYREGRESSPAVADLPTDEEGNARIVCRRYAERRAVAVDDAGRPSCFDPDHPDCQGCVEDVREGVVETW